jgi:hypothetical protein
VTDRVDGTPAMSLAPYVVSGTAAHLEVWPSELNQTLMGVGIGGRDQATALIQRASGQVGDADDRDLVLLLAASAYPGRYTGSSRVHTGSDLG